MTNLKKELINILKDKFTFDYIKLVTKLSDVDVHKYLFELKDGKKVEAVLMNHDYGNSLCISTQVGCNMGCAFCESGRLKKQRDLMPYEMIEQILLVEDDLKIRISHVVLMGIGEPFDNYDNVMKFFDIVNEPLGIALGARHITVSTCGLIPKIEEFSKSTRQVNLAISLHAPNDELRSKIMPINKVYKLNDLINTLRKYIDMTGRRVTFEYIMLGGINDSLTCADELASLLKNMNCYVNLIPYNETSHIEFVKSNNEYLMAVADGMGGHRNGEVASSIAISHLGKNFKELGTIGTKEEAINWLKETASEANALIYKYTEENPESVGMGTTLVVAIVTKDYLLFGNIGDSSGELTEEEAKEHPRKNVLMKALGANVNVEMDIFNVEKDVDGVFLCSDGLTNMLDDDQIVKVLNDNLSCEEKMQKLIYKCNNRGGNDNISVAYLIKDGASSNE